MIKGIGFSHQKFNFPCGEMQVRVQNLNMDEPHIIWEFEHNEEIFELLLIVDALKRNLKKPRNLYLPYVPFSRQDRVNLPGEALSCSVFCFLINSCNFKSVCITDPHSDVTPALINRSVVITQKDIFNNLLVTWPKPFTLICPDGGAVKKIQKFSFDSQEIIYCLKCRDSKTGNLSINIPELDYRDAVGSYFEPGRDFIIVDDICDGGRTFIEIAKLLREFEAERIILMVTHGFFTKGLEVFDGLIDEIYTRKGRVK